MDHNNYTNCVINNSFDVVNHICGKFNIDESHALKHSIEVFNFAKKIYESEIENDGSLVECKNIIFAAAILHDMCDKKYMNEEEGISEIKRFVQFYMTEDEINAVVSIITTMSYSKVKVNGYPNLGKYQMAFHIVREADLLAAYDIDRCLMFSMFNDKLSYTDALCKAKILFISRVLTYRSDNLFVTEYSKSLSKTLHNKARKNLS
jgi:HD superfamily phosphodiesterase